MESAIGTGYIVFKALIIGVFFLVFAFSMWLSRRGHAPFSAGVQVVDMLLVAGALVGYALVTGVTVRMDLAAVSVVVGVILGVLFGLRAKAHSEGGRVYVTRPIVPALLFLAAYVKSLFFNLFGTKSLMSVGMLLVIGATAAVVAVSLAVLVRGVTYSESGAGETPSPAPDAAEA